MSRLNIERQKELEPKRLEVAKKAITGLGYAITFEVDTTIHFIYKGETVKYFPYSGWHTGKSIKDGRGLQNLLNQLTTSL
jgi:hypothetical protein